MAAGEVRHAYPCRAGRGRISAPLRREECYPGSRVGLSGSSQQFVKFLSRTGGITASEGVSEWGSRAGRASAGRRANAEFHADKSVRATRSTTERLPANP